MNKLAILLTSFNRKENTLACIQSIYTQINPKFEYKIFLTIDGSTDGTEDAVKEQFPDVNLFFGDGNLFWAGGMRYCYENSKEIDSKFDYYLLLNDDTVLFNNAFEELFSDFDRLPSKESIMVGSTQGQNARLENNFTYGGKILLNNYNANAKFVLPNGESPQICHLGNANIMLVPAITIQKIGFLSDKFTHGIADYEYTLRARKYGISSYITSNFLGTCHIGDNQVKNWKNSSNSTLKERINYLYSPKGLAYKEYLFYIRTYFPIYFLHAWSFLWLKTFFPIIWDKLKKR
jgi:GT2 family glycosyltransferase